MTGDRISSGKALLGARKPGSRSFTLALERHDRHMPFFMGAVTLPEGVEIVPLEIGVGIQAGRRDGRDRHGRMFRDREFDICEQSLSSYIMAKARGAPFTATPVFPRRLFSQYCMYINRSKGIAQPADLAGKKVGILSFQTTLCVQAKGDLKTEYGVDWRAMEWFVQQAEELAWDGNGDVSISMIPKGKSAAEMLISGDIDALFMPNPDPALLANPDKVSRLFADPGAECVTYYRANGYCPIMHLMVFPSDVAEAHPWLPKATIGMFDEATRLAYAYYDDPNYSLLLFARDEMERQRELLGTEPWTSGLAANRANLERFIGYMADQKLIDAPMPVEELFHSSVVDT